MKSEKLDSKVFEIIKNKVKISPQSIRNEISNIRRDNPGVTLKAAAALFAKKRGFHIFRYLDEKDRLSLQYAKNIQKIENTEQKYQKIKSKDVDIPFGEKFIKDANENAKIYPYIYVLENSLRDIIVEKFKDVPNWWNDNKIVSRPIQDYAETIQRAESEHAWLPERGNHPIFYVNLDHLYKIIDKNWGKFKKEFRDLGNLRTWINECVPIRNQIAHNVKIRQQECRNIKIRAEYICNLIGKKAESA